jgi:histone acetyltransferase HTATIP
MTTSITDDHKSVSWLLRKFAIGKDFKCEKPKGSNDRTGISIDRATHEFGIIYYDVRSVATVQQFPDTDKPVYFEAKTARAACRQDNNEKITVLFQHLQLDLYFVSIGRTDTDDFVSSVKYAHEIVNALEGLAAAAQNKSYATHTIIAKGFEHYSFDMATGGCIECVVQAWMTAPTSSSHWPR